MIDFWKFCCVSFRAVTGTTSMMRIRIRTRIHGFIGASTSRIRFDSFSSDEQPGTWYSQDTDSFEQSSKILGHCNNIHSRSCAPFPASLEYWYMRPSHHLTLAARDYMADPLPTDNQGKPPRQYICHVRVSPYSYNCGWVWNRHLRIVMYRYFSWCNYHYPTSTSLYLDEISLTG